MTTTDPRRATRPAPLTRHPARTAGPHPGPDAVPEARPRPGPRPGPVAGPDPGPRPGPDAGPALPPAGEEFGFTLARTAVLACGGVAVDRVLRLPPDRAWAVLAVVTVLALTPVARLLSAAAGALLVWLLGTGFVAHRFGETTFDSSDRGHLAVVALAAAVAWAVSRRAAAAHRRDRL